MKSNRKLTASVLCIAILANSAWVSASTAPTTYSSLVRSSASANADLIREHIKIFNAAKDSGANIDEAMGVFASSLINADVTLGDFDAFMRQSVSRKEYKEFKANLEIALAGIDPEHLTEREFADVVQNGLASVKTEGLSWAGCAAGVTGLVIGVAAIVVGIVGLTKTASDARIKRRYAEKRADAERQYNRDVDYNNNRVQEIDQETTKLQAEIRSNNEQIVYLEAKMVYEDSQEKREQISAQIQSLRSSNNNKEERIATLSIERSQYSNPNYVAQKNAEAYARYESRMYELSEEEQRQLELAPYERKKGWTMAIIGGSVLVPSVVFAVGGLPDCN